MSKPDEFESRPPGGRAMRALREIYGEPADAGYWDALEARILARLSVRDAVANGEWWASVSDWGRLGLVAAAAALIVGAAAMVQSRETEARLAYEAVLETPPTQPLQEADHAAGLSQRDASLKYVLTH